jgi:hypothetical protein
MATTTQIVRGGIRSKGDVRVFHTGEVSPTTTTTGTDTTPATTVTYFARVFVPVNALLTGVSLLNGSAVAGNVTAILYDADGVALATSASTAQSGTAAFQAFPFSTAIDVQGPGRYWVAFQFSSTSARFRTHTLGVFPTGSATGGTYGTIPAITPTTTFTTAVGPVASTY